MWSWIRRRELIARYLTTSDAPAAFRFAIRSYVSETSKRHTRHSSLYDGKRLIYLWLDDDRPAPEGWIGVTTIGDAKLHLETGRVDRASLDHDLGACETCMDGMDVEEWLEAHHFRTMPHCRHVGTGYDLCVWMAETGHWPKEEPTVHSANRVGRRRMKGFITKYFRRHH